MEAKLLNQKSQQEKLKKIANTIRVKMSMVCNKNINISELDLPRGILLYLQDYGYIKAQDLFQAQKDDLQKLARFEEILNSLNDIGIYYIWEDSNDVKKDNVVFISEIGLSEREKRLLLRNNITTIVELEIFIRTRRIDAINGIGSKNLKSITKQHEEYLKQCDEEIYDDVMLKVNQLDTYIQRANRNCSKRENALENKNREFRSLVEKDAITVFEEIFGKTDNRDDLELSCVLKALRERRTILVAELLSYGELSDEEKRELRSLNSIKDLEK